MALKRSSKLLSLPGEEKSDLIKFSFESRSKILDSNRSNRKIQSESS